MSAYDEQVNDPRTEPLISHNKPEITFFRDMFKTYANFGIVNKKVSVTLPETGALSFGNTKTFRIPSGGDLITKMYLNVTLPAVQGNVVTGSTYANWVNNVGHALITKVQLFIGQTKIDEHSGVYLDIINELTDVDKKDWKMIGKYESNIELKTFQNNPTNYIIPLKFFFNKNNGVALPLFVLGNEKIKISVTVNSLANLVLYDGSNNVSNVSMNEFSLGYDTISLSYKEKEAILRDLPSNLLIETVQSFENLTTFNNLKLENPVKELIFVFQKTSRKSNSNPQITLNKTALKGNDIFNYSGNTTNNSLDYDIFNTLSISWGTTDIVENNEPARFFKENQVNKYHSRKTNKNIYTYSFSIEPESHMPSGYINFSKEGNRSLSFNFNGLETDIVLNIYAITYEYLVIQSEKADKIEVPYF